MLQHDLQVGDAGLDLALLVLGGVILGVLGQVAIAAGHLDLLRHFLAADDLQMFQLILQGLQALLGYNNFFGHN